MRIDSLSTDSGRTLIEVLIVGLVMSIVVGLTASLFAAGTRTFSRETTSVSLHVDLAAAKNVVLDDLSIAGYRPDGFIAGPFVPITATGGEIDQIAFVGDVDSDGASERICYSVDTRRLVRTVQSALLLCGVGQAETLAEDVESFNVVFYDAGRNLMDDTAVLLNPEDVRYVQVILGVSAVAKGGTITKTISGEVALRNWVDS